MKNRVIQYTESPIRSVELMERVLSKIGVPKEPSGVKIPPEKI